MSDKKVKTIGIGCDHLGLEMKNALRDHLAAQGVEVKDLGVNDTDPVDYPDMGAALARELADGAFERGILVCGTGAGMAIAANKVPGVRAVCVTEVCAHGPKRLSVHKQRLPNGLPALFRGDGMEHMGVDRIAFVVGGAHDHL